MMCGVLTKRKSPEIRPIHISYNNQRTKCNKVQHFQYSVNNCARRKLSPSNYQQSLKRRHSIINSNRHNVQQVKFTDTLSNRINHHRAKRIGVNRCWKRIIRWNITNSVAEFHSTNLDVCSEWNCIYFSVSSSIYAR